MSTMTLDIGGEGRHPEAWNLNPSRIMTCGLDRGKPIPRLIYGRADDIPLPNSSVDIIVVERTPISRSAIAEIGRIARPGALIIFRHARPFSFDPHRIAKEVFGEPLMEGECFIGNRSYQETVIELNRATKNRSIEPWAIHVTGSNSNSECLQR